MPKNEIRKRQLQIILDDPSSTSQEMEEARRELEGEPEGAASKPLPLAASLPTQQEGPPPATELDRLVVDIMRFNEELRNRPKEFKVGIEYFEEQKAIEAERSSFYRAHHISREHPAIQIASTLHNLKPQPFDIDFTKKRLEDDFNLCSKSEFLRYQAIERIRALTAVEWTSREATEFLQEIEMAENQERNGDKNAQPIDAAQLE